MNRLSLVLLLAIPGWFQLAAQEFSGGFRAGINFATIDGPSEASDSGNSLEEYKMSTGFHVGATANLKFNDYFGLRAELLYSQKGTDYNYNGQSFWILYTEDDQPIYATGDRNTSLSITNSYIDIPFMAVGRYGRVEISGGASLGFLVSSRGSGELTFSGQTAAGSTVDPFTVVLDFSYFDDTFRRTDIDDVEILGCANSARQAGDNPVVAAEQENAGDAQQRESANPATPSYMKLFPNPVREELTVIFHQQQAGPVQLMVTNLAGQLVYRQAFLADKGRQEAAVDASQMAPGVYVIHLLSEGQAMTKKFVVAR